jgi:hypothetical protein
MRPVIMRVVQMHMTVLDPRRKVFEKLLEKEPAQHAYPHVLNREGLTKQFRQNMNNGDGKEIGSGEHQDELKSDIPSFRQKEHQQSRQKRRKKQNQCF